MSFTQGCVSYSLQASSSVEMACGRNIGAWLLVSKKTSNQAPIFRPRAFFNRRAFLQARFVIFEVKLSPKLKKKTPNWDRTLQNNSTCERVSQRATADTTSG